MKKILLLLLAGFLCLNQMPVHAQPGGGMGAPKGPSFGGSLSKLLGDTTAFSATMELQTKGPSGDNVTIPGKISFLEGKSRTELDMSKAMGPNVPPEALAQMKAMGMDAIVIIAQPEKKLSYTAFPGMKAYFETAIADTETTQATSKYKVQTTELGKETVDGHPCIKNQVVVTDDQGTNHVSTVWNATDLKKFPVKIESTEQGQPATMLFKDIKLAKPDAALFAPPTDFQRYNDYTSLLMQEMMKRQGGFSVPAR
jgi:hypothetical protein